MTNWQAGCNSMNEGNDILVVFWCQNMPSQFLIFICHLAHPKLVVIPEFIKVTQKKDTQANGLYRNLLLENLIASISPKIGHLYMHDFLLNDKVTNDYFPSFCSIGILLLCYMLLSTSKDKALPQSSVLHYLCQPARGPTQTFPSPQL